MRAFFLIVLSSFLFLSCLSRKDVNPLLGTWDMYHYSDKFSEGENQLSECQKKGSFKFMTENRVIVTSYGDYNGECKLRMLKEGKYATIGDILTTVVDDDDDEKFKFTITKNILVLQPLDNRDKAIIKLIKKN